MPPDAPEYPLSKDSQMIPHMFGVARQRHKRWRGDEDGVEADDDHCMARKGALWRRIQSPIRARAFFSGLHGVASRSPYCSYCLRTRSLCNLSEKGSGFTDSSGLHGVASPFRVFGIAAGSPP